MSTNLYCKIIPKKPPPCISLGKDLKYAIARRFFDQDGSCRTERNIVITREELPYFRGLADAGVDRADVVVKLLEKDEAIEIWIDE